MCPHRLSRLGATIRRQFKSSSSSVVLHCLKIWITVPRVLRVEVYTQSLKMEKESFVDPDGSRTPKCSLSHYHSFLQIVANAMCKSSQHYISLMLLRVLFPCIEGGCLSLVPTQGGATNDSAQAGDKQPAAGATPSSG